MSKNPSIRMQCIPKGEAMGYGLKVWPEDLATVKKKAPEAIHLEGL